MGNIAHFGNQNIHKKGFNELFDKTFKSDKF